jgi:acyl-CoA synthetase (NDP forming)
VVVDRILEAKHRDTKPLAVFLAPRADSALVHLQSSGVASFRTPESCADAVNAYLNWQAPTPLESPQDVSAVNRLLQSVGAGVLNERDSMALFSALSIPVAPSMVFKKGSECKNAPDKCAVKILSADIPHKTDAGMVRLNVATVDLPTVVDELLTLANKNAPGARIDGVLVQPMEKGLMELIVGYKHDPELGPVVMLGVGGVLAELKKSYCVRLAPISLQSALQMILELPELALIQGYRNLPQGDVQALANVIHAMSLLAGVSTPEGLRVMEAEINPLMVKTEGVVAVDGLVSLR